MTCTFKAGDRVRIKDSALMKEIQEGFQGEPFGVFDPGPYGDAVGYLDARTAARCVWRDSLEPGFGPWEAPEAPVCSVSQHSQHPADLKPRNVKAPMYLIPWSAVPGWCVPEAIRDAASRAGMWPDGDAFSVPAPDARGYMARFVAELFGQIILTQACTLEDIARVFAYGAQKYARDNWRTFTWDQAASDEYWGAICRHLLEASRGNLLDDKPGPDGSPGSGLLHTAHAATGCLIWLWHLRRVAP